MQHRPLMLLLTWIVILLGAGCNESQDARLSHLVQETTTQQASQNRDMTGLNREAAENHRRVVEVVEKSRQEITILERDLQQQRDKIDAERQSLAIERHRESILGPVLSNLTMLLLGALPLVLCWYLLHGLSGQTSDAASEILIEELLTDRPLLELPERGAAVGHEQLPPGSNPPF